MGAISGKFSSTLIWQGIYCNHRKVIFLLVWTIIVEDKDYGFVTDIRMQYQYIRIVSVIFIL